MALIYIDGFDAYGAAGADVTTIMAQAGWVFAASFNSTPEPVPSTDTGSGYGLSLYSGTWGFAGSATYNYPTTTSAVIGIRFKGIVAGFEPILSLGYNDYIGGVVTHCQVAQNGANGITITTSGGGTYSTPPNVIFQNVHQYIELSFVPGTGGAGSLALHVDGVQQILQTSIASIGEGQAPNINFFRLLSNGGSGDSAFNNLVDDLYIEDMTGDSFNGFLGDVVVHTVFPVSDAGTNEFSVTGGIGGHWGAVQEQSPDGDTSYLYSNTSGKKELFNVGTIPPDVLQVLAVGINVTARKDAAGVGTYNIVGVSGSNETDSPAVATALGYINHQFLLTVPPGAADWTLSLAQAMKIGVKIP